MTVITIAVGVALFGSLVLFVLGVLNERPEWLGLLFSVLAVLLYLVYYSDVLFSPHALPRDLVKPLALFGPLNSGFRSTATIAVILVPVYALRIAIYVRVFSDAKVTHVADRVANFAAGVTAAILLGGTLDSALHGGWVLVFAYASAIVSAYVLTAILGDLQELARSELPLLWVRIKRKVSTVTTEVAKTLTVIASLHERFGLDWERRKRANMRALQSETTAYVRQRATENKELTVTHRTGHRVRTRQEDIT